MEFLGIFFGRDFKIVVEEQLIMRAKAVGKDFALLSKNKPSLITHRNFFKVFAVFWRFNQSQLMSLGLTI